MEKHYTHIDFKERDLISKWLSQKISYREIGRRLGRSHTSISREYQRNKSPYLPNYHPTSANIFSCIRKSKSVSRDRLKTNELRSYVCDKLKIGWTPEIISGRLKLNDEIPNISHEAIYQYIYVCKPDLIEYLPRKHRQRRKKVKYRKTGQRIPNRTPISERSIEIELRKAFGHWESDSVISGDKVSALNVLVERKTRLVNISVMKNKTASQTADTIKRRLKRHPTGAVNSITYDNGTENVMHESINESLGTDSFFCEPYHSWEKGSVEQLNGLIRR